MLSIQCATLSDPRADSFVRHWTTSDDHARAVQFRSHRRRGQCLMARALLRNKLATLPCASKAPVAVAHDTDGRPYLTGDALRDVSISIAHSGSMVTAAISDFGPVGIDIEDTGKARDFSGIERWVSSSALPVTGHPRTRLDFYLLWTASEAFLKTGHPNWLHVSRRVSIDIAASDHLAMQDPGIAPCMFGSRLVESHAMSVAVFPAVLSPLASLAWSSVLAMPLRD